MFASIEKCCCTCTCRSRPTCTTKSYASRILRIEPTCTCSTLFMWNDLLFFDRPVLCESGRTAHAWRCMVCDWLHAVHCTRSAKMITHVSMCTTSVLHDHFFDLSQKSSSVFTHVFVISSVDISTHSEMLMSVLLQN